MSDMIDRLKAVSREAGRDAITGLTDPSTIAGLADRVHRGVRRRRIRMGAIGASLAVVAGAAALAAPTLLGALPDDSEVIQPRIIRTVGPITTYDDGSASVVLSSGDVIGLSVYEGDVAFRQVSRDQRCAVSSPEDLPSGTWTPTGPGVNQIIVEESLWWKEDGTTGVPVLLGANLGKAGKEDTPDIYGTIQVDPAIAPFIAVRVSIWDFKVTELEGGGESYYTVFVRSFLDGDPKPEYSGSAELGTRVGTLTVSPPTSVDSRSMCYTRDDVTTPGFWTGTFAEYVVIDVFLMDYQGGEYTLGTSVYWFEYEMSE